jgi:MFS family permease
LLSLAHVGDVIERRAAADTERVSRIALIGFYAIAALSLPWLVVVLRLADQHPRALTALGAGLGTVMTCEGLLLATDWRGATESLRRRRQKRWRLVGVVYAVAGTVGILFGLVGTIGP